MTKEPSIALGSTSSTELGEWLPSNALVYSPMKDVDEIRRANLQAESVRLGGDAKLARAIGKDKNQVYQWLRAPGKQRRNISKTIAREIEPRLERERGWLDVEHAIPPAAASPALEASRPKNNIQALRFAMQGLATALARMQPDIAEDVARDIVEVAGIDFSSQGFVNTLVGLLAGVERTSEEGLRELLRRPVSSVSKRVSVRAK